MAENLPDGFVPDAPPPEGFVPDTARPEGFIPDDPAEPANLNVGVMPMPSREQQDAALRSPPTALDTAPGAYTAGGPQFYAFQAANRGLTGQQAGEALQLSKATGFGPDFAADNAADLRTQADRAAMTQGLARSPVLASYAAQSSVHAAAIRQDMESMTAVEYWLTGKWQDMPGPAPQAVGPYALAQTTHEEMVAPPVWQSGLAKFAFGVAGGLLRIKKATVGLTPEESQRLEEDVAGASGIVAGAGGDGIRGAGAMAAEMVPALVLAPGSKPAQAAYFTLQAFPGYYRTLGEAVDEHGAPRFSDFEAKTIATGAALGTGVGSTLLGGAFLKAIPGAAQKLNGLLGESIVQAFTENPTLAKVALARVVQAVPHMASGVAMMTASGGMNGAVKALADGHSPLSPEGLREIGRQAKDGSETGAILSLLALYGAGRRFAGDVQRVRGVVAEGPQVVPPEAAPALPQLEAGEGPTIETTATREGPPSPGETFVTDLGRAADSATEAAQLDGMVTSASASGLVKNAPQEAQRLFALMAQQGPHDTVYVHPDAAKDEKVARAIDTAMGDGGQARALAEAQGPGGMIAVPIEKYLTQIASDHHDAIRDHVRLSPDGMTPAQSREALPGLQGQLATLPSDGEANALAAETPKPDTLGALMAARDYAMRTEPDTPERAAKLADLEDRMRGAAARGSGLPGLGRVATPEEVAAEMAKLEAELAKPSAAAPPPPPPDRSAQYAASAKTTVNALPIRQIHPGQFALAARQASDRLAKEQAKAVERLAGAGELAQAGIDEASAAAETARRGAGNLGLGLAQARELDAKGAGKAAQKLSSQQLRESAHGQGRAEDASVAATGQTVKAGEHMAEVERIAHERDFSRALAKEAAAVKIEMDRELASIQRIAGDREIRGQLGLAHPAFRDTFDAIAEAVGARQPQPGTQRQTVDQLLQVLNDKNLPAPFDEGLLKDIVADPRPWKDLTPVEARQSANAAASIVKMGLDLTRVAIGNQKIALAEAKANVVAENALRKDLGAPPATLSARTALDVADAGLSTLNAWNLKPEVAMQTLGKTMHGVFLKTIDGRNYLQKLQGELLTNLMENVGEIGWIKEPLKTPSLLRMPRIGDPVLAPRPVTLPKTLAAKYGNTPAEWEALLNDKALPDLPSAIRERLEKVMEEWKHAQTVHSMPDLADKFNKETMAMLFLNLGTASNEQRLTSGYNWSGQTIRSEIGKHLTLEQVDQLQGVLSLLDKQLWPLVKEHAERTTGLAPPKIQAQPVTIAFADGRTKTYEGGYFPAAPHPDAIDARAVDKAAYAARATVAASFTKERAERASYPLDLNWRRVGSHINSVLHYLAYDEPVRDISKMLDDGAVQMVIRHSLGDANLTKLTNWRDTLAVGRVDNTGPMAKVMGKTLRSRAVTNALSLNLPIAYMQASHIPFAVLAGEISAKNATLAAGKQVPFTQQWIDLRNEMTELQFRSTRWAEQYRTMMAGETSLLKGKTAREIDHYAFLHMEAADAVVSHIIADAALNDAIEQGMDREAAREYANAKVRLLMPTHNVFEMSALGRNPGFVGTVSLFRGLSSVVWNVNYNLFDKSRQARFRARQPPTNAPQLPQEIDMEEAPDGTWGMKAKADMYSAGNLLRMLSASAVLGTLGYLLAGHGKNKDDKRGAAGWGQWAARTAAASELEEVPGGRDLAAPFIDAAVQHKSLDWALEELKRGKNTPEVAAILSYLTDLGKMVSRKQTTPQKIQAATNATLAMAGIGVRPVTAMGVNAVQGNPKMRRPRGVFDRLSQFVYPTRTYEKTWLNAIEDAVTGTE